MPSRRRYIGGGVTLALVVLCIILAQNIGRYLMGRGLAMAGHFLHARISYQRITGNPFTSPVIDGLKVVLGNDSLEVERVGIGIDIPGVFRRRLALSNVAITSPTVYVSSHRPAAGPEAKPAAPRRPGRFPPVSVGKLGISGGTVVLDTLVVVDSLDFNLWLVSGGPTIRAGLEDVAARVKTLGVCVRRLAAQARLTHDSLVLSDLVCFTRESRAQADCRLEFASGGMSAAIDNLVISLPEFSDLPGRINARGKAAMRRGEVSGDLSYAAQGLVAQELALPRIDGRFGLADSVLVFEAAGRSSELGSVVLEVRVDLRDTSFSGTAELAGVAVRRIDASLPDFRVGARVGFGGRGRDSVRASIRAQVADLGIDSLQCSAVMQRGCLTVQEADLSGPLGRVQADGLFAPDRVVANCRLDSLDLSYFAVLAGSALSGHVSGAARMWKGRDSWTLSGGLQATGLAAAGVSAARAAAEFDLFLGRALDGRVAVGAESLCVRQYVLTETQLLWTGPDFEVRFDLPKNRLRAVGQADLARDRIRADVEMLEFATERETLATTRPFEVAYMAESLRVSGVATRVAGGSVDFDMAQAGRHQPSLNLRVRNLALDKLRELLDLDIDVRGLVDLDVSGSETLDVALTGSEVALPRMDLALSALALRLHATRTQTAVEYLKLSRSVAAPARAETSVVSGVVRYDLGADSLLSSLDLDLKADLRDPGEWVLSFLKPSLEFPRGTIYGLLSLSGPFREPSLDGRVRVSRATLRVPAINTSVDRLNAELAFSRDRIIFEKLSGRSSRGAVSGTGFIDLGPNWGVDTMHYDIRFTGATVNPQPEIYAVAGGNIFLDWARSRPLVLSGTVDVSEALVAIGFGQSATGGGDGSDTLLEYDIRVRAERGIWLRNSMVDIELGMDLTLRKNRSEEVYSGELSSRQGNVYYLDNTLRVTHGVIAFPNITTLNPDLDILAELPVRPARDSSSSMPEKVLLSVAGTLEQPRLDFRSEPAGWDEADIASYLNLSVTPEQLSALEQRDAVTRLLSQRLLSYFQTQAAKRARGFANLDYLEIESGLLNGRGAKVTVGKYVGRKLYVSYTQGFTSDVQTQFRVEYYINRRNELVAERNDQGRYALRYRFKLRY